MERNLEIGSSSQHSERKEAGDEQSHQTEADLTKRWWRASSQQEIESKGINTFDSHKKISDDITYELTRMRYLVKICSFTNVYKKYRLNMIDRNEDKVKHYNQKKMENILIGLKEKTGALYEAKKLFDSISDKQAKIKKIINMIDFPNHFKNIVLGRIDSDNQSIKARYNEFAMHYSNIIDSKTYLGIDDDIKQRNFLIDMKNNEELYRIIDLIDNIAHEQGEMRKSTETSDFPDSCTRNQFASDEQSSKELYGKFLQYYVYKKFEERAEKDKNDMNLKKIKQKLMDIKEIKVLHQASSLFDDIDKVQDMMKSIKISHFSDSFKPSDIQQIHFHKHKTNELYEEFKKYYLHNEYKEGFLDNIIAKLLEIQHDIRNKISILTRIIDLRVNDLDDLKLKINNRYQQYLHSIKEIKIIPEIADKRERTLFSLEELHGKFSHSCEQGHFLEAGKWAKEIIFAYEEFGRYYAHAYFKAQFTSEMRKLPISLPEQKQLAEISRHTPVSNVPKELQEAFVIARGKTIAEKVNGISEEYIGSNEVFNNRYYNKVKNKFNKDTKKYKEGEFLIKTYKKGKRYNLYTNSIDINNYEIKAMHNFRDQDVKYGGNALPNSEILHNQWLLLAREQQIDPPRFPLQRVIREAVTNQETKDTSRLFAPQFSDHSQEESTHRFEKGSDEYYAMLGTPNVYGIFYLLKQHQDTFGKREITSIEVDYNKSINITLHINEVIDARASEVEPD